jgi:hypothetical protein
MILDLPETHVVYILQVLQERPYRECQPTIDLIAKAAADGQKPVALDSLTGAIPAVKIPGAGNGNSTE